MPTYKNIKPNELKLLIDEINDLLVIDCRTKEEVDEQSLNYDINIDLYNQADIAKIGTLDSEKSYLIYCHRGSRSSYFCTYLSQQGFKKLYNLDGGIALWNHYNRNNLL